MKNTYRTIDIESDYLLKEKQSKFYGCPWPERRAFIHSMT